MTNSIWPNEFYRNIQTWPKTDYYENWLDELDRKSLTTTKMIVWIWPEMENIISFSQIQPLSVKLNKVTFVVVIFRSCSKSWGFWVSVIFNPTSTHIELVMLTSLASYCCLKLCRQILNIKHTQKIWHYFCPL